MIRQLKLTAKDLGNGISIGVISLMVAANFQQIASVVHDIHRYKLLLIPRNDTALLERKGDGLAAAPPIHPPN